MVEAVRRTEICRPAGVPMTDLPGDGNRSLLSSSSGVKTYLLQRSVVTDGWWMDSVFSYRGPARRTEVRLINKPPYG